jgi:predicted site-specific integrase-resolvase
MKTKEVLNLLQISRATLFKYRKLGYSKATRGLNGFWEYDEQDIASGISFKDQTDFFNLLENVFNHKIERIVISYKDRISRVGFELFQFLFKKFGTEIIVMSEVGAKKLDSEEIFEEIVSLLHCYSMKLYSKSRSKLVKQLVCEE